MKTDSAHRWVNLKGMREIGDRFAKRLQAELQRPEMYRHDISLVVSEKSAFVE